MSSKPASAADLAGPGLVAVLAAVAGALAWASRDWPLVHDAPLMHYVAWRISEGAVPYRDLFDMNFPGVYLIHLGVLALLGPGDAAWRAFDLAWLAAGALLIVGFARPWGAVAASGAASLFAAHHLAGGAWQAGQRDFLLCPFLVAGALGVARWVEARRPAWLVAAGLALGAGATIKPHVLVFAAGLALVVAVSVWRRPSAAAASRHAASGPSGVAPLSGALSIAAGARAAVVAAPSAHGATAPARAGDRPRGVHPGAEVDPSDSGRLALDGLAAPASGNGTAPAASGLPGVAFPPGARCGARPGGSAGAGTVAEPGRPSARDLARSPGAVLALYSAALAVVPALVVAWLADAGALPAWREIAVDYLLPLYSRLGRPAAWGFHRWHVWIPIGVAVVASLATALLERRFGARHAIAAVGLAGGIAHYFGQGKGWEYHVYPLSAFASLLAFAEVGALLARRRWPAAAPAYLALSLATGLLAAKGAEASDAAWIRDKVRRVEALTADLAARLRPGDQVQVLDTTDGGIHALLRLGVAQPTRFLYDFHFFHDFESPVVRRLRAELVRDLDARPPRAIVVFDRGWPAGGRERLDAFPELADRLARHYRLAATGDGYTVHEKRDGS